MMERSVAIKKLSKLLGKKLGYRVNSKAPTLEERAAAKTELPVAIEERNKLKEKRDERYKAILAADTEYQSLFAAHRAASERTDKLGSHDALAQDHCRHIGKHVLCRQGRRRYMGRSHRQAHCQKPSGLGAKCAKPSSSPSANCSF